MKKSHVALLSAFALIVVLMIVFFILGRAAVGPSHQWVEPKSISREAGGVDIRVITSRNHRVDIEGARLICGP